ncbi:hypothetical protein SRHO_G00096860 [Serrasalmus rhombeus]
MIDRAEKTEHNPKDSERKRAGFIFPPVFGTNHALLRSEPPPPALRLAGDLALPALEDDKPHLRVLRLASRLANRQPPVLLERVAQRQAPPVKRCRTQRCVRQRATSQSSRRRRHSTGQSQRGRRGLVGKRVGLHARLPPPDWLGSVRTQPMRNRARPTRLSVEGEL